METRNEFEKSDITPEEMPASVEPADIHLDGLGDYIQLIYHSVRAKKNMVSRGTERTDVPFKAQHRRTGREISMRFYEDENNRNGRIVGLDSDGNVYSIVLDEEETEVTRFQFLGWAVQVESA